MYPFFMLLSVIVVFSLSAVGLYKKGLKLDHSVIFLLTLTSSFFIGARLLNYFVNNPLYHSKQHVLLSLSPLGLSLYGGIILSALVFLVIQKIVNLKFWPVLDVLIPSLGAGIIVIRIGCLNNGCCFGKITSLPWGITYPALSNAHKFQINQYGSMALFFPQPVHPTQIYEIAGVFLALVCGYYMHKKYHISGTFSLLFTVIFSLTRLINHYFRASIYAPFVSNIFYPVLYSLIILISVVILFRRINTHATSR